jgi:hypothetical protein
MGLVGAFDDALAQRYAWQAAAINGLDQRSENGNLHADAEEGWQ